MEIKEKQRWLQMGAELEGAWGSPRTKVAEGVRGSKAVKDLSVKIGIGDPGEIITRPHAELQHLCEDIYALWPDHVHVSCGFHIHASFTPLDASVIASQGFYDYFKTQWEAWGKAEKLPRTHEFWVRLQGRNVNARDEFVPEKQLIGDGRGGKGGNARYTMLNFYSWELHRTVECRLLPMFQDKELGVKALKHLAWVYDSYLNRVGFPVIKVDATTEMRGERVVERYEVKMPDLTPTQEQKTMVFPKVERGDNIFYAMPGTPFDDMLPFRNDTGKSTP